MYEVELKFRASHERVRDRLRGLDADRRRDVEQIDTYYDAPHRDFTETDEALRLRRETPSQAAKAGSASQAPDAGETRLTYKGPLVDDETKTREEHETGVTEPGATTDLLAGLGFEPAAVVEKERERYDFDEYTITLDKVTGLGQFVEIERDVPPDAVESAREGAFEIANRLGLDPEAGIRTSYLGLLLEAAADPPQDPDL